MLDKRLSLWDINIREIRIGNAVYILQNAPARGGSCMVYSALKQESVGGKVLEHRVLLKEFYPFLYEDNSAGITRAEDGRLVVSESTQQSNEYQIALKRFQNAYSIMLELANADEGAEYLSIPTGFIEDCGTWYLEENYDSGIPLSELFVENEKKFFGEEANYNFAHFLDVYCKCLHAVGRLHKRGFYHLDLKPQNVSYTRGGNAKLFDTDTFLKKSDLENAPVFVKTEGYTAPEVAMAALCPEDAPYLIGPWTDIYSLTQFICWYLYGRPLNEQELQEQLEYLEEKIKESFKHYSIPPISPKGLYRLKHFLMKNLSSRIKLRSQSVTDDMLPEIDLIRDYLFYDTMGEPIDNFKESTEPVLGFEKELDQLKEVLLSEEDWGLGRAAAALIGTDKEEREKLARYYATIHRLDYGDIVEIHCDHFEGLIESIEVAPGVEDELKNPHCAPALFLIFDEQEENILSRGEAVELNELMRILKCRVLIVGRHNRCLNRRWDFDDDIEIPTIEIPDPKAKLENDQMHEKKASPGWFFKTLFRNCLLGIACFMAGEWMNDLAFKMAEACVYYQPEYNKFAYSSQWMHLGAVFVHVLGSGLSMLGLGAGVYCIYELMTPHGWKAFVNKYNSYLTAGWMAIISLRVPGMFWEASLFGVLCNLFGLHNWTIIDACSDGIRVIVQCLMLLMLGVWIYGVIRVKKRERAGRIEGVLLVFSVIYMLVQMIGNVWERVIVIALWLIVNKCIGVYYGKDFTIL